MLAAAAAAILGQNPALLAIFQALPEGGTVPRRQDTSSTTFLTIE